MNVRSKGEKVELNDDSQILSINSPKDRVSGPYKVIYANTTERWAIVAMEWDKNPCLAMRWFWGRAGNPTSSGYPTWLVIPNELNEGILASLPLDHNLILKVNQFLSKKVNGSIFN